MCILSFAVSCMALCFLRRWSMEAYSLMMGWYFLSLWLSTLEFWKCSMRELRPWRRA